MSGRVSHRDGAAPRWQVAAAVMVAEVVPVGLVAAGAPPVALLPWLVPAGAVAAGAVAVRVTARRARRERWAHGWGLDPDASTPGRPWPVTACPGREPELAADGLAWSVAGCPTPPRGRPLLWCAAGHPAVIPQLSLWSPLGRFLGREPGRWACPQGHRGVLPDRPPVTTTGALVAPVVALPVPPGDVVRDVREVA